MDERDEGGEEARDALFVGVVACERRATLTP